MKLQGAKTFLEKRAKFYNKTFEEVLSYIYEERHKKGLSTSRELQAVEVFYMALGMVWDCQGFWRTKQKD